MGLSSQSTGYGIDKRIATPNQLALVQLATSGPTK